MTRFIPQRIELLLDLEDMTQQKLAQTSGVPVHRLREIRAAQREFDAATATAIAEAVRYPVAFLAQKAPEIPTYRLTNRKSSRTRAAEMKGVTAEYNIISQSLAAVAEIIHSEPRAQWLEQAAAKGPVSRNDIDRIAAAARGHLGIKTEEPIGNVMWAVEGGGVAVVPFSGGLERRKYGEGSEGVSAPEDQSGFGLIGYRSGSRSGDGVRFTVAHELGHLLLHRHFHPEETRLQEKEANLFAGSFLMPKQAAESLLSASMGFSDLALLKSQWGISMSALISIAFNRGIIDQDRRRSLMMQLSARGWRKHEPVEVREEHPLLFKQMLGHAFGEVLTPSLVAVDPNRIAERLGVPKHLIDVWADGLEFTTEEKGRSSDVDSEFERIISQY